MNFMEKNMSIPLSILDPRLGSVFSLPTYASAMAAGIDLIACIDEPLTLSPQEKKLIPTGIAVALPEHTVGLIFPRSGLGHKHGLLLGNGVGVIDPDYRGQIFVSLWNQSGQDQSIYPGDRIAQMVIMPILRAEWQISETLEPSARGDGGFGSTGKQ